MATTNPMVTIRQYINDFNKGDGEAMAEFRRPRRYSRRLGATCVAGTNRLHELVSRRID